MGSDDVRLARAYLSRVVEPPAPAVLDLIDEHGVVKAAELVAEGPPGCVASELRASEISAGVADWGNDDLGVITRLGGRLVIPEDEEWPRAAFAAFDTALAEDDRWAAPIALWVQGSGRLDELAGRAVSITGARAATGYGEHVAAEFSYGLAEAGYAVISGGAYGVDAAAHRGALAFNGRTVAVLACGVDRAYPSGHHRMLTEQIPRHGLVVSEHPPGVRPTRDRFLPRNRIIAALGLGTVMVEAGVRSGSRNTMAAARALGRPVMAVPGPVTSALSAGCHLEVRDYGAALVTCAKDIIGAIDAEYAG